LSGLIQAQTDLGSLNSFGVAAKARWFAGIESRDDLEAALSFARERELPLLVLGGGSNCLFVKDFPGLVMQIRTTGIQWLETPDRVRAAAGENWHQLVTNCLNKGKHGLENLALIPGSVGAAPIQNIGAYGVELSQFLIELETLDLKTGQWLTMDRDACDFGYRSSVFKTQAELRYLIWNVTLQLDSERPPQTGYGALRAALNGKALEGMALNGNSVNPRQVYDTVIKLRQSKLPDPALLGNAGSFFKNPLVSEAKYETLRADYPELPAFPAEAAGLVKLPAAWLLEQAGWKGRRRGQAGVHDRHALVLVNHGGASGEDIYLLAQEMSLSVLEKFGIALEPEVRII